MQLIKRHTSNQESVRISLSNESYAIGTHLDEHRNRESRDATLEVQIVDFSEAIDILLDNPADETY